jgi:hypothetical protein
VEALLHLRVDVGRDPTSGVDPGVDAQDLAAVRVLGHLEAVALAQDRVLDQAGLVVDCLP